MIKKLTVISLLSSVVLLTACTVDHKSNTKDMTEVSQSKEMVSQDQRFSIANAEKIRDEHPRTFSIPRLEQRESLKVGDNAKVILESIDGTDLAERPWILITKSLKNGEYEAKFDNDLVFYPESNHLLIKVRPENIISVILPENYELPYTKTCLVSKDVAENTAWPLAASREVPDAEDDSGWTIYGIDEGMNEASIIAPCAQIMSGYPVLDSILDEPNYNSWAWDDTNNEFKRLSDISNQ